MATGFVGFMVDKHWFHFGHDQYLFSFFSTVTGRLEKSWGERFPVIMNGLCEDGCIKNKDINCAQEELRIIREELKAFPPKALIWDIEHPEKMSPWGRNNERIRCDAQYPDLSHAFRSEDNVNLLDILEYAFRFALERNADVELQFHAYKNK